MIQKMIRGIVFVVLMNSCCFDKAEAHRDGSIELDAGGIDHGPEVWAGVIFGSVAIGLVGILPLFLISTDDVLLREGQLTSTLRTMLGFACGGLLGNAYLHLLPEAYNLINSDSLRGKELTFMGLIPVTSCHHGCFNYDLYIGLWTILGILSFIILEKFVDCVAGHDDNDTETSSSPPESPFRPKSNQQCYSATCRSKGPQPNCSSPMCRQHTSSSVGIGEKSALTTRRSSIGELNIAPAGYLNLIVNAMDNFTHGLAVAGSFCVSTHVGIMTVLAIVIHEVPHEIGDYAILVKSGFNTRQAIISQLVTSLGGLCGGVFGMLSANAGTHALWILPFTAGGFSYISLVSLVSDMNEQETPGYPWYFDVLSVIGGIALVGSTQVY